MKILQIAYFYPPMGGAAVQRALKFSKYLPEFDVHPVVLAADDPGYVSDGSMVKEIPASVEVHRVGHRPLLQTLMSWRRKLRGANPPSGGGPAPGTAAAAARPRWRDLALSTYAALQFPDDKATWARRARAEARRILGQGGFDLIYSSSPPVSSHQLACSLGQEFGLPWVADFRDLWTDNPGYVSPAWRRAMDRRREDRWLAQASGIVAVTPSWREMLAQRSVVRCPVAFIPNGYDEPDFAGLAAKARADAGEFRLVHTGAFYGPRDPAALLEGLSRYLSDNPSPPRRLRLRLVGEMGSRFAHGLARFQREHPGVVEQLPYVPHRQALAELVDADALLLVVGGEGSPAAKGWLPGKLFEYLRADKPILLLGHRGGDAAGLVHRHSRGVAVDESDPAQIAAALGRLVDGRMDPAGAGGGRAEVGQFERRELARRLAAFLRDCKESHRGR